MYLDEQTVRTGGDGRAGHGCDLVPQSGAVAGIDEDRQVTQLPNHWNRRDAACVACSSRRSESALAQHDGHIAPARMYSAESGHLRWSPSSPRQQHRRAACTSSAKVKFCIQRSDRECRRALNELERRCPHFRHRSDVTVRGEAKQAHASSPTLEAYGALLAERAARRETWPAARLTPPRPLDLLFGLGRTRAAITRIVAQSKVANRDDAVLRIEGADRELVRSVSEHFAPPRDASRRGFAQRGCPHGANTVRSARSTVT